MKPPFQKLYSFRRHSAGNATTLGPIFYLRSPCSNAIVLARPKRSFSSSIRSSNKMTIPDNSVAAAIIKPPHENQPDYSTWSQSSLISRIAELERQLNSQNHSNSTSDDRTGADAVANRGRPSNKPADVPAVLRSPSSSSSSSSSSASRRSTKKSRDIDPSKYNMRFIALKFAYLGQRYNGYEHANGNTTPLPTIEEELWKALRKARLIFPQAVEGEGVGSEDDMGGVNAEQDRGDGRAYKIDWTGCQYSKCGRTDRGVSAFGQVVGIRVRSARPKKRVEVKSDGTGTDVGAVVTTAEVSAGASTNVYDSGVESPLGGLSFSGSENSDTEDDWDDIADELPYITILNRVLPEDIRVLAWCPNPPPDFDARFSCRERRYRYFFTQPAFSPTPGPLGFLKRGRQEQGSERSPNGAHTEQPREGWLDIEAMREGAKYLIGSHDFRNFCKVDPSKQITNHVRHIYHADIELLDPKTKPLSYLGQPGFRPLKSEHDRTTANESTWDTSTSNIKIYTITIHGSAFLWHQVRHLAAILFLVGQGLEPPSIIPELLDVERNPRRPTYEIASDAPLVLWDCVFPDESSGSREDAMNWVYAGDSRTAKVGKGDNNKFGQGSMVDTLWRVWRQRKIDEILAGELLDLAVSQGDKSALTRGRFKNSTPDLENRSQKVFYGGNEGKFGGKYVPLMQRRRLDPVEVINARYTKRPGKKTIAQVKGQDISNVDP
ncbi:pseudouridylate synthase 3 [Blastomyces gilchristii SLH14081]|uniref:Pseudouridylate synthase 3 n=1 Tax=Blastomyces gilchristii (strain SLH14081) TaxID=559298 RepID=A0A179UG55_BLAGS|nr:pseudouridylate synthase 3 [Blastomyces gilchristii SLH14081]OAT06964.1 pseudouridylate synthase 3 [Blastomyces gilchristii SLH14081]